MEQRKVYRMEPYYYSDKLKHKLDAMRFVPTAIVDAPSGYGKTTAVREYFVSRLPKGTPIYWFTGAEEAPASAYRRLCQNIEKIDRDAGERLLKIEFPNAATIGEVTDALRSIKCMHESYIVIDNLQLLFDIFPNSFFKALFEHWSKKLHIIFITQLLRRELLASVIGHEWLHIDTTDLRLCAEDIRCYYTLAGVGISFEEAQTIARYTEGWIIAVYLQLSAFRETGKLYDRVGIMVLMEHLLWDALSEEQRTFLLCLSPFETVTLRQACALTGSNMLPEYAMDMLESPFIRYEPLQGQYEVHSILLELLARKRSERGAAFERECLLRAGDYCRDEGELAKAMSYYAQIKDYERMLLLDFSHIILDKTGGKPFAEIARDIAENCPAGIKRGHILSMLRIAWTLLMADMAAEFDILMKEIQEMLDGKNEDGASALLAEWTLLSSFRSYPRLKDMTAALKEAAVLFKGKYSQVILPDMPWWFGEYSPFTAFHNEPGEADREADALEEYITLYSRLTNGHGSGADVLFRAELAFHRGSINDSEILSYKAVFLSESRKQSIVQLGATLRLAQTALHKADAEGWQNAISSMEQAASYSSQNTIIVRSTLDIVRGILFNELINQQSIADWLKQGDFSKNLLPATIGTNALFVHLNFLMNQAEFIKLIGTSEALMPEIGIGKPFICCFLLILSAVGHTALGYSAKAKELLKQAAEIALPDGLVFPFAAYSWLLQGLADEMIENEYTLYYARFKEIKDRYGNGWDILHNAIFQNEFPADLTPREYEVALLAAEGLRNSEIAQKLTVTESTVRAHLRVVFEKLQIDRRAKLAEKLK